MYHRPSKKEINKKYVRSSHGARGNNVLLKRALLSKLRASHLSRYADLSTCPYERLGLWAISLEPVCFLVWRLIHID